MSSVRGAFSRTPCTEALLHTLGLTAAPFPSHTELTMPHTPQDATPGTAPARLAYHAEMVASFDSDLTAERAALHEALSERADDGTPRWSHQQMLAALEPLVSGQYRPPELRRPLEAMKGRRTFTTAQAQQIYDLLVTLKQARASDDRPLTKTVCRWLREVGFYLSDWKKPTSA
jgi:hypothetical protein